MKKVHVFFVASLFFIVGCNSGLSEDEKKALWDNAQSQGEVVRRSGTPFNLATDKDLAMSDAENRLSTGGGLLGKKANYSFLGENNETIWLGKGLGGGTLHFGLQYIDQEDLVNARFQEDSSIFQNIVNITNAQKYTYDNKSLFRFKFFS